MTPDRRAYARKYAARKRDERIRARLGDQMQHAARCPWPVSGGKPCGGKIEVVTGQHGQTLLVCDWCERRRRGLCRDCAAGVEGAAGRALRCAVHKRLANRASMRRSDELHHEERLIKARAYYQANDERRRIRNEFKRAWRKANPEKVRAQKQRYVARHRADPTSTYNRYHRKYRAKYRLQKRELERDRIAATRAPRKTSPKCTRCGKATRWKPVDKGNTGRPWTVCTPCLYPCERKARMRNRRRARVRAKEWLASIPPAAKIKRPPLMAVRGPGWERTCVTPDCDIVVTHRKKKCTKCRERDRQLAEVKLAPFRGRGRRHDLRRSA